MASSSGPARPKHLQYMSFIPTSSFSLFLLCCIILLFIFVYTGSLPFLKQTPRTHFVRPDHGSIRPNKPKSCIGSPINLCKYEEGKWVHDGTRKPLYNEDCPFQRNAWNCIKNKKPNMDTIFAWKWVPDDCELPQINPHLFLSSVRNMNIGFIGDSLNENLLVSFLCILRTADEGARKWKRKGAWKGAYFPKYNVTVGYHRAVLLAKYERWQPARVAGHSVDPGVKGTYRVDVDIPADDWINVTSYYDVFIFNTGHWWGLDKFPKETPLVFYREGSLISPLFSIKDGLHVVLQSMASYIERTIPKDRLKLWRTQSPRHFHGGEWNQNGSCTFDTLLGENKLDDWFDPKNSGINQEARAVNTIIKNALQGTSISLLELTHLSEFRADAHPAIWLGRKDAVAIWGQDCMHWCLPGVPDTWVDVLWAVIAEHVSAKTQCFLGADE
uniref:Uncharacterized protein n=1 Tax=Araucaria cunninghamii TaxID=56994 RepID=A0A0D6R5I2_ARACU